MRVTLLQFHISAAMYMVVDAYRMIVLSNSILIDVLTLDEARRRLFGGVESMQRVDVKTRH